MGVDKRARWCGVIRDGVEADADECYCADDNQLCALHCGIYRVGSTNGTAGDADITTACRLVNHCDTGAGILDQSGLRGCLCHDGYHRQLPARDTEPDP